MVEDQNTELVIKNNEIKKLEIKSEIKDKKIKDLEEEIKELKKIIKKALKILKIQNLII